MVGNTDELRSGLRNKYTTISRWLVGLARYSATTNEKQHYRGSECIPQAPNLARVREALRKEPGSSSASRADVAYPRISTHCATLKELCHCLS